MEKSNPRPLSPHLQVYRPQLTTVLSILHRITGAALAVGLVMVVWMLIAAAGGEAAYNQFARFCGSPPGQLLLLGWTFALYYHACNGIRHLIWDTGRLFEIGAAYRAGYVVLAATVLLTALTWSLLY